MFNQRQWEALVRAYAEGEECPVHDYIMENDLDSWTVGRPLDAVCREWFRIGKQYLAHVDAHTESTDEAKELLELREKLAAQMKRLSELTTWTIEARGEEIPF